MSVDADKPNSCVSAERNVECYLVAKGVGLIQRPRYPP